jgi:hypothetical protein
MTAPERWLPAPDGWEDAYEASDSGRARSLVRMTASGFRGGRILKPHMRKGYLCVTFWRHSVGTHQPLHRLVAATFLGPCPSGMECCHGKGGVLDNRLANLYYDTHENNTRRDKVRDGTMAEGVRHGMSKLTEAQVTEIRERYAAGENQYKLARAFSVHQATIQRMLAGKTWDHVSGPLPAARASRGEVLSQAKLTAAAVAEIRVRYASGELQEPLAREYGVCVSTISKVIKRKAWDHVA